VNEFSGQSKQKLESCHPELQRLFREVIKHYDCTVTCGHRNQADQEEAFRTGKSTLRFPSSKQNTIPSLAVVVVPFPIDWKDMKRFYHFAGFVRGVAAHMGINIRSGLDWNGNMNFKDENFHDAPHFELIMDGTN
jgi:peptidoglycan L-alanyl-D-glutamate endopeptidase CwlK